MAEVSFQHAGVGALGTTAGGAGVVDGSQDRADAAVAAQRNPKPDVFGKVTSFERRGLFIAFAVVLLTWLIAIFVITFGSQIRSYARGERDLMGRWQYSPRYPVEPRVLAAMPHDDIHRNMLPRWVTAAAHFLDDPLAEREAFEELHAAIAADGNLSEVLEEQRAIITDARVLSEAERLHYLVWAWNRYIDRAGYPFLLEGNVGVARGRRSFFYITSYRTFSDIDLDVGGEACRVRLVGRIDPVNVRELHIGGTRHVEDGAVVVVDRLQEFALDAVWPALAGPARLQPGSIMAAYSEALSEEVGQGIGQDHLAVLRRTARWRARFVEIRSSMAEREGCSSFAIPYMPYDGHNAAAVRELMARTYISIWASCPQVKLEEMLALHKGSEELQEEEELSEALEALLAWLARVVATHEARHVADLNARGSLQVDCDECGPDGVTAEVSAYLASFAWSDGPITAYYQACRAVASERNPHAAAMEAIDQWLDNECYLGPPNDLPARARVAETEHLRRSQPVVLPAAFPAELPVSRTSGRRRIIVGQPEPAER